MYALQVMTKLGRLYSEMIFVQGYIHCDPHPGNLLVRPSMSGTEIVLLDHGVYQVHTVISSFCNYYHICCSTSIQLLFLDIKFSFPNLHIFKFAAWSNLRNVIYDRINVFGTSILTAVRVFSGILLKANFVSRKFLIIIY